MSKHITPDQQRKMERYARRFVGISDEASERIVAREVECLSKVILQRQKTKRVFWAVKGNWNTSRFNFEMDNPNANLHVMGIFRTKREAFEAVEKNLNAPWNTRSEPIKLLWTEISHDGVYAPGFIFEFRACWTEPCDDGKIMHCQAVIETWRTNYLHENEEK